MISQIKLNNFKCFEDETIIFTPFNVLTGLNGMGKSTVIQALLLLRQNYQLGLLKNNSKGISLNGELIQIGNAKDILYQYFELREICIKIISDNNHSALWKWDANTDGDYLPLKELNIENEDVFCSSLFNSNFHYLCAERIGPRVYFETSNYKVINQNQIGIQGEFAANFLSEFQNNKIPITQLKHPSTDGLTLYEQINAWLSEIRPGTRISVASNLDMSLIGLTYQFLSGGDVGNKFRPTNVGFGLSYLFPILVAVLSSIPGTLLLLENPEAHLHPQGQVKLCQLLAKAVSNGIQIILETHSDHILNGVRVAVKNGLITPEQTNILYFTGETINNKFRHYITSPRIDIDGRIDIWPDGFFDEWEKQLTNLI